MTKGVVICVLTSSYVNLRQNFREKDTHHDVLVWFTKPQSTNMRTVDQDENIFFIDVSDIFKNLTIFFKSTYFLSVYSILHN